MFTSIPTLIMADVGLADVLWSLVVGFFLVMFLIILINVVVDIFRSRDLSGWAKAIWLVVIVVLPLLGSLIYLIARGDTMGDRAVQEAAENQAVYAAYVRENSGGAAGEIERAEALREKGAITDEEYARVKARALGEPAV